MYVVHIAQNEYDLLTDRSRSTVTQMLLHMFLVVYFLIFQKRSFILDIGRVLYQAGGNVQWPSQVGKNALHSSVYNLLCFIR